MTTANHVRRGCEIAAEIAAQLMWGAKTISEVCAAVAPTSKNVAKIRKYIEAYRASGCAYIDSYTPRGAERYGWNAKPFARDDATRDQVR